MISKFFIDRPIFAVVISLIISILGIISIVTLPVAKYPQVTPPQVRVSASYPGANAEVIGTTVASVIERQMVGVDDLVSLESSSNDNGTYSLTAQFETGSDGDMDTVNTQNRVSQVSGIKTLSSTVLEGYSETVLEFNIGVDPQVKASEVREKVASVRKALPDDIDEPVTQTVDLNSRAIVAYTFASPSRSRGEIRRIVEDNIKDELQMVEGVSEVTVVGASQRAIRIVLKPEKLAEYGIGYQTCLRYRGVA